MKPIGPGNYTVRPFKTYKRHSYSLEYSNTTSDKFSVYEANINSTALNANSSIRRDSLHQSILHMFYANDEMIEERGFDARLYDEFYVIAVNQTAFGEGMRPGTIRIQIRTSVVIIDDGNGKLFFESDPSTIIGNVLYGIGILVFTLQPV